MSNDTITYEVKFKKLVFKQSPAQKQNVVFNMLYNNKKVDCTDPFTIQANAKIVDLTQVKALNFDTKDETVKYPIFVYVLYGQQKPRKIILKRSDMLKKYQLDNKSDFSFDQDFGAFTINYQVNLKKVQSIANNEKPRPNLAINNPKAQSPDTRLPLKNVPKYEQSPQRTIKRPSMLQIGEKAERIRKSSAEHKQLSQSAIKIEGSDTLTKTQKSQMKDSANVVPPLTLSKDVNNQKDIEKKDVKMNLFEMFTQGPNQSQTVGKTNTEGYKSDRVHGVPNQKEEQVHGSHKDDAQASAHGSHHSPQVKHSKREVHGSSHGSHDQHDSHDHDSHHDEHGQGSGSLSLKLKTVIVMLIIGFLFLMYDALDDRFSRRIRKQIQPQHSTHGGEGHGEGISHHEEPKKKKTKKVKKTTVAH